MVSLQSCLNTSPLKTVINSDVRVSSSSEVFMSSPQHKVRLLCLILRLKQQLCPGLYQGAFILQLVIGKIPAASAEALRKGLS